MNFYVLVEGSAEKIVYKSWIPFANESLTYVDHFTELVQDNFTIVSGGGYPRYLERIQASVEDVGNNLNVDRLVVAIDSEDMTRKEKYEEVDDAIKAVGVNLNYRIIVQHFCLETWALGNQRVVKQFPTTTKLQTFKQFYDVRINDPEGLPAYPQDELNRAQFAKQYLKAAFLDRNRNFSYTTRNPGELAFRHYFDRVRDRLAQLDT